MFKQENDDNDLISIDMIRNFRPPFINFEIAHLKVLEQYKAHPAVGLFKNFSTKLRGLSKNGEVSVSPKDLITLLVGRACYFLNNFYND